MDGSVVIHLPDLLVRVSHHGDGWTFMEFRPLITKGGRDSCRWGSSQDEHKKDEVTRHIFLVLCSMPIPWISHLPSWTMYLDEIRLEFPYAISCPLVHIGRSREIIIKFSLNISSWWHVSSFYWLQVSSIHFFETKTTCHYLISWVVSHT